MTDMLASLLCPKSGLIVASLLFLAFAIYRRARVTITFNKWGQIQVSPQEESDDSDNLNAPESPGPIS